MGIRPWIDEESPAQGLVPEPERIKGPSRNSVWWQKLHRLLSRDESSEPAAATSVPQQISPPQPSDDERSCSPRKVGVGLPRMATFRRQNSEKRERLEPVEPCLKERRAISVTRQRALSAFRPRAKSSPPPNFPSRESAPVFSTSNDSYTPPKGSSDFSNSIEPNTPISLVDDFDHDYPKFSRSRSRSSSRSFDRVRDGDERAQLEAELDSKWILNLSMHFRDKSDREKFFVTYAATPNRWRRVTVSCDYRNAEPGSLEMDLKELQYQRDKSVQIYESIRESLPEIQFYDTVTNLKLETSEGRLHVHVTEDVNEIIPYPPKSSVSHVLEDEDFPPREIKESELVFDSHLSGFVYKVKYCGKDYVKKEIPGPDTVDEFLYEVNALHALTGSSSVIQLEAIVVDDQRQAVKGLLIGFAEKGAVVDLLYDNKGEISWNDRVRWARQAVQGLCEVHEEGYVQGDFTLSNIVIDGDNNAKIIDINRRGCPVGWEPPELAKKIASNQRISMYIGEKSDLYQLGMTLWALAMDDDEPERHDPPLIVEDFPLEVPRWYSDIVEICLQPQPRDRVSAKELLKLFPPFPPVSEPQIRPSLDSRTSTARSIDKQYIEPSAAVEREDIERFGYPQPRQINDDHTSRDSTEDQIFTNPPSSSYQFESGSSYVGITRGRRPPSNMAHLATGMDGLRILNVDEATSIENCENEPQVVDISPSFEREYDEIDLGGHLYLVSRSSFDPDELRILDRQGSERRRSIDQGFTRLEPIDSVEPSYEEMSHDIGNDFRADELEDPDIELELEQPQREPVPAMHMHSSMTSASTPRGKPTSVLLSSGQTMPPPIPPLDLATADLAGFGAHPTLDEHSPHEPKTMPHMQSGFDTNAGETVTTSDEPKSTTSQQAHQDDEQDNIDDRRNETPNDEPELNLVESQVTQYYDAAPTSAQDLEVPQGLEGEGEGEGEPEPEPEIEKQPRIQPLEPQPAPDLLPLNPLPNDQNTQTD